MPLPLAILIGLLIPFLGTSFGALSVFLLNGRSSERLERLLCGFASGVMIAASVWSLIIPAINMAESSGGVGWIPAAVGLLLGVLFLCSIDLLLPARREGEREGRRSLLFFSVTLHNLPEGMAVGVVYAALLGGAEGVSLASAIGLSIGIALQNLPEGAVISVPMASAGASASRSFAAGVLSGAIEPLGAALMLFLSAYLSPLLPYLLSFAAGAMLEVVVRELIPASQTEGDGVLGVLGVSFGFSLMMILDVVFG